MKIAGTIITLIFGVILGASLQAFISKSDDKTNETIGSGNTKTGFEDKQIVSLIGLLNQTEVLTLADYQQFFADNDIHEILFEWDVCNKKGWKEPIKNQDCFAETLHRWSHEKESPSYFLAWLKTQLPSQQPLKITSVQRANFNRIEGQHVNVQLGQIHIEFWTSTAKTPESQSSQLEIISINQVPISILEQQASISSMMIAMGLERLIHPLTDAEWQQQSDARKKRCREDAECTKWLGELEQQQAGRKKQQEQFQQFNQRYRDWCKANTDQCQKMTQERQAIVDAQFKLNDADCAKNFDQCVEHIKQLMQRNNKAREPFCQAYPKDCKFFATAFPEKGLSQTRRTLCEDSGINAEKTLDQAIQTATKAMTAK